VTKLLHSVNMSAGCRDLSAKCDDIRKSPNGVGDFAKTIPFLTALQLRGRSPVDKYLRGSKRKETLRQADCELSKF